MSGIGNIGRPAIDRSWLLDLSPTDQVVLQAHAYFANAPGRPVFPSVGLIAWMTGLRPSAVKASRTRLRKLGVLEVVGSLHPGQGRTVRMRINLDAGPERLNAELAEIMRRQEEAQR